LKVSLRLQLFGSLVLLPIIVAAVITVIAIQLFHKDKELYVYDLSAQSVELVARNLASRLETLHVKAELAPKAAPPFLALTKDKGKATSPSHVVENVSGAGEPRLRVHVRSGGRDHLTYEVRPESLLDLRGYSGPTTLIVVNSKGEILVHSEASQVAERKRVSALVEQLKPFSRRGTRVGTREVTHDGRHVLAAFARVGDGLAVLQTLDKAMVGAASRPLVTSAVIASLGVVLVAVLVALILGRTISRPLRAIARQAEAIGRGEFGVAVSAGGTAGEMAQLTDSFNAMSAALKKREEELLQVQRQLLQSERLNASGRMISAIAKEISDPLEQCFTLASQSRHRLPESSSLRNVQRQIMDEANRASNILQNLARISSHDDAPQNAIEPDIIVSDVLVSSRPLFEKRQLRVTTSLDTEVGRVLISPDHLRNALLDIFLYVSGQAAPTQPVNVALDQQQGMLRLAITFGGTPLSEEERGSLLRPAAGESALELAVAAMVFEEQGGRVALEPTQSGNRILATLPVAG
jgi:signal transduction histidine kinase